MWVKLVLCDSVDGSGGACIWGSPLGKVGTQIYKLVYTGSYQGRPIWDCLGDNPPPPSSWVAELKKKKKKKFFCAAILHPLLEKYLFWFTSRTSPLLHSIKNVFHFENTYFDQIVVKEIMKWSKIYFSQVKFFFKHQFALIIQNILFKQIQSMFI